jgi:hypothetical protein
MYKVLQTEEHLSILKKVETITFKQYEQQRKNRDQTS